MYNNPISFNDPEGDCPFCLVVGLGAINGIFSNGLSNLSNGQNFFNGAGKAALWGGVSAAASYGIGEAIGAAGGFGTEVLRAGAHGVSSGIQSELQGGSFGQGFLSGSISSGIGSGIGGLGGGKFDQILGGGLGGGIGAALAGSNFFEGLGQGIAVGAFNHALHGKVSALKNESDPIRTAAAKALAEVAGISFAEAYDRIWWNTGGR